MQPPDDNDNNMLYSLNNLSVEVADPAILPLIKRFFQHNGMRAQAAKSDRIFIARLLSDNNRPVIAALRLCKIGEDWLLRSMCVEKSYQRQGIGLHMLQQINKELKEKNCVCFPYSHLQSFYQQAGFQLIDSTQVSADIQQRFRQYNDSGRDIIIMQMATQ